METTKRQVIVEIDENGATVIKTEYINQNEFLLVIKALTANINKQSDLPK